MERAWVPPCACGVVTASRSMGPRRRRASTRVKEETRMAQESRSGALPSSHPLFGDLGRHWGWLLAVGVLSIVLGVLGLGMSMALTLVSVFYFGVLLIVIGGAQ